MSVIKAYPQTTSAPNQAKVVTGSDASGDKVGLDVTPVGSFKAPGETDAIVASYPDAVTEVYAFKSGGTGGTTLMTLTVVYVDSTKELISTVVKT